MLGAVSALYLSSLPAATITEVLFAEQDVGAALLVVALFVFISLPSMRFGPVAMLRIGRFVAGYEIVICMVAAVVVIVFTGWWIVCWRYPLTKDEYWALFDAEILRRGHILAGVPVTWRPYVPALARVWRLETPGNQFWASTYLPMNAAFLALFGAIGSTALAGAFWSGLSIILTYLLGRRFWPERRDAAFVAAVLLATSSQLVVTAMTPYAMSAHLALNLAWLCLFLHKGRWAQCGAVAIAFVATGLHQWIFHPLFAAPFVAQLWAERRWRKAAFHTTAYSLICLFWISYPTLLLVGHGVDVRAAFSGQAHGASTTALAEAFKPAGGGLMAENLFRFVVWQNPLTTPLALIGMGFALRSWRGPLPSLAAGAIATVLFLALLVPAQGHGWGYRYLHGFLGSFCLLAAYAWTKLTGGVGEASKPRAWAAFAAACLFAVMLLLPLRLFQVWTMIRPNARAVAAIQTTPADIVIVDPTGSFFGGDLIRNDPWLANKPKVLYLGALTEGQVRELCTQPRVALFDRRDADVFGIDVNSEPPAPALKPSVGVDSIPCGRHVSVALPGQLTFRGGVARSS